LSKNREKLYSIFAITGMMKLQKQQHSHEQRLPMSEFGIFVGTLSYLSSISLQYCIYNHCSAILYKSLKYLCISVRKALAEHRFHSTFNIFFQSVSRPNCVFVGRFASVYHTENQHKKFDAT